MSEKLPPAPSHESLPSPERHELLEAHSHETAAKPSAETIAPLNPEQARAAVEAAEQTNEAPNPLEQLQASQEASQPPSPRYINQELQQISLRNELRSVRRQLSAPQRALSRVIHQPAVRAVSAAAGQTVSRPSGLLGGGVCALFGSGLYLYLASHLGFTYNYGVWLSLLVAGFVIGLTIELLIHIFLRHRQAD